MDAKRPDLDSYRPPHKRLCEFRPLATDSAHRQPRVLQGLMLLLAAYGMDQGIDLGVMSPTTRS